MDIKYKIPVCLFFLLIGHSSCNNINTRQEKASIPRIKNDLVQITQTSENRYYKNAHILDQVAEYIFNEFKKNCDTVHFQEFEVNGITYKNVVAAMGEPGKETIVIGAHYDVAGDQQGADDNASGVAGLLELARLLKNNTLKYRFEFVAYTLEEPPYFKTGYMGSYIHASKLFKNNIKIKGMICLEMIGYFNDTKGSQDYPLSFLKLFYGDKGDFITVVQKFGNGRFGRKVKRGMKKYAMIKTKSFKGPVQLPGIDFSDHLNYWKFGYSAVMITNTSFYRNKNYHRESDTIETLDLDRMSKVIESIYRMLLKF